MVKRKNESRETVENSGWTRKYRNEKNSLIQQKKKTENHVKVYGKRKHYGQTKQTDKKMGEAWVKKDDRATKWRE